MVPSGHDEQIYLSPHLDDVALSCGGRIWQQARSGASITVITVFAGAPDAGRALSPFARELHARWGTPEDAVRTRRREDQEALAVLGAHAVHWGYQDCIYRRTAEGTVAYPNEEALWGPIDPVDTSLIRRLRDRVAALTSTSAGSLYVPLAAGGHVDHRIVRRAAEDSGARLTYYEDFPYAQDAESLKAATLGHAWDVEAVPLSEAALRAKVTAIARYASQLSTFWGSREAMAESVRAYARQIGAGSPTERYWRLKSV